MKLQPRSIESFLRKPDPKIRAVLFFGPDDGLVRDRAATLGRTVVADLSDPFRVADLPTRTLADDPARLMDEMAALALTGGRRLVRVRDAEDNSAAAFTALLKDPPAGDTLVVAEAGDLGPRSKLRVLFEGADNAAAVPCYVEDEASLGGVIEGLLRAEKLSVDGDALAFLAGNLVGDRMVARGEIAKLALYMGPGGGTVRLEDARACIGDSSTLDADEAVWAAADGNLPALDRALGRLFAEGASPVAILRAAQRHFHRLHLAVGQVAAGKPADVAVASLKPPVMFKLKNRMTAQVRRWQPGTVRQALDRLTDAEAECKRTNAPDVTLCARVLFQIGSLAGRR